MNEHEVTKRLLNDMEATCHSLQEETILLKEARTRQETSEELVNELPVVAVSIDRGGASRSPSQAEEDEDEDGKNGKFRDRFHKLDRPDRDESGVGWWRWSAAASPQKVGRRLVLRV